MMVNPIKLTAVLSFDFMQVNSLVQKLAGKSERIPVEQAMDEELIFS